MGAAVILTCDTCHLPIGDHELRYTIADNPEAGTGRHSRCRKTQAQLRAETDEALGRVHGVLDKLARRHGLYKSDPEE